MSQNKTIIPESEYDIHNPIYSDMNSDSELYRPSGSIANNTVIAGTTLCNTPPQIHTSDTVRNTSNSNNEYSRHIQLQERVIVGVLFSISKGLLGEIFPIYLGRNMLGSLSTSDICLKEKTVSEEHAVLHARCDGYPGDCYLSITDYGSSYGTMVNQTDCRYETLKVNDGDVLSIGKHYRLSVKLFDISKSGLFEDSGFEGIESLSNQNPAEIHNSNDFYSPSHLEEKDNRTVIG